MRDATTNNDENDCVASTVRSLEAALSALDDGGTVGSDVPPVFTDEGVLARPPFAYIHALARFFARRKPSLGWTELLFGGRDDDDDDGGGCGNRLEPPRLARKEKLEFLSRLLAVASNVTGTRCDVLVAPSGVLCGRDAAATRGFLRALASSTTAPGGAMSEAVERVAREGGAGPYRRGVRARRGFARLQALARGRRARRRHRLDFPRRDEAAVVEEDPGNASDPDASDPDASNPRSARESDGAEEASKSRSKSKSDENERMEGTSKIQPKLKSEGEALRESYEAVLARKSKVEEELKVAEERLNRENHKLIRMLNLGTKHKTRVHNVVPHTGMLRPPLSAPNIGRNVLNSTRSNGSFNIDESFHDKITNFSERQRSMKLKERRMNERERRLKQRFANSKQKEAELKLQEERISEVAARMRKQQLQLKEQRLQLERSRALEPAAPPEETTRPCLLCTQKKMKMREIQKRVRHRARQLGQREADVVGRAHELRRREVQLARRERVVAELEEQHSLVDDLLGDYNDDEESRPPEKHRRRHNYTGRRKEQQTTGNALPNVREDANSHRPKGARKRRRRSPQKRRPSTPQQQEDTEQKKTLRAPSFGEGSITTIAEETPAEEQEDSIVEEVFKEADASEAAARGGTDVAGRRRGSSIVVPTDVRRARQQLGISKSLKSRVERRSTFQKLTKEESTPGTRLETTRRISQPPPPKQRHVFTFERRESQRGNVDGLLRAGSKAFIGASPTPNREKDKKSRVSYEKHDDWISSFDVQMKCAMNRLKDLV